MSRRGGKKRAPRVKSHDKYAMGHHRQCFTSCGTPKQSLTKQQAETFAWEKSISAYECTYCNAWHTGNPNPQHQGRTS